MIDKLITLEDGTCLTIIEKVKHNAKLFILAVVVDKEKEEITNNMILSEIKIVDGAKIVIKDFDLKNTFLNGQCFFAFRPCIFASIHPV